MTILWRELTTALHLCVGTDASAVPERTAGVEIKTFTSCHIVPIEDGGYIEGYRSGGNTLNTYSSLHGLSLGVQFSAQHVKNDWSSFLSSKKALSTHLLLYVCITNMSLEADAEQTERALWSESP